MDAHDHPLTRWADGVDDCCSKCEKYDFKVCYRCFPCGYILCEKCFGEPPAFYQLQDYINEFSVACTDTIKRCESDLMKNEQFIPSALLHGLVPSALLDTHDFWQDAEDNLRGYPQGHSPEDAPHIVYIELISGATVDATQREGCVARITKRPKKSSEGTKITEDEEDMVLLNLLYAPTGTPLFGVANVLSRIENLSYVLPWCKESRMNAGEFALDKVELPRLNLAFQERLQPGTGTRVLCSMDHANLFLPTFSGGEQIEALLAGIPHSILLCNDNRELHVLVPNIRVVRPIIGSSPFNTELVLDRSGILGKKWSEKTQVGLLVGGGGGGERGGRGRERGGEGGGKKREKEKTQERERERERERGNAKNQQKSTCLTEAERRAWGLQKRKTYWEVQQTTVPR